MKTASRIEITWDDQPGVTPGWYAEVLDADGAAVTDSMKVNFPVDVDNFAHTRRGRDGLVAALESAYPDAEIFIR